MASNQSIYSTKLGGFLGGEWKLAFRLGTHDRLGNSISLNLKSFHAESRTISLGCKSICRSSGCSPSIDVIKISIHLRPESLIGRLMVVKDGQRYLDTGSSPNPTTAISRGISNPCSRAA